MGLICLCACDFDQRMLVLGSAPGCQGTQGLLHKHCKERPVHEHLSTCRASVPSNTKADDLAILAVTVKCTDMSTVATHNRTR